MSTDRHLAHARAQIAEARAIAGNSDVTTFAPYVADPVAFAVDGFDLAPWSRQRELLEAVSSHERVAVASGHKTGKTLSAVLLALWWLFTRPTARVILTAPITRQIREVDWRELRALIRRAKFPIGATINDTPAGGLRLDDGREILGFATDQPESFAGISGAETFFIVDESSGVPDSIFEVVKGSVAGGGRILGLGNPTQRTGWFADAFGRKAHLWKTLHIPSTDSPNITGEASIPGLATQRWVDEMAEDYGAESSVYAIRVKGEFPSQQSDAVIPFSVVEEARARWSPSLTTGPAFEQAGRLELGCDPARYGDDETVIVARRGPVALEPFVFRHLDSIEVAARVVEIAQRLRRHDETVIVRVDSIGIGAGVVDQLKQSGSGILIVVAVNVGEAATIETYARLRDQVWFAARDWLKAGGCLPPDPRLEGELIAPTFGFDPRGKIKIESKDATKARLRRSPDRADALCLAVFAAKSAVAHYKKPESVPAAQRRI